jgi:hypothetical protein
MEEKPTIEELQAAFQAEESTSSQTVETETVQPETETTEDPLKVELERVKGKKTPQEKAKDSLFFNAQKAKELGIDVAEVLGIKPKEEVEEDDKPVTRKELEELLFKSRQENANKTAEQLASEIGDEYERELTLFHIQNTIKSTGDPKEDLKLARALTNSVRNSQILEEIERKPQAKSHSSATSGSTANSEHQVTLTHEEQAYLNTGLVTKEEILLARQGKPIPQK